jgi:DNA repair exonuclease SbcCD ATPase subunit
MEEVSRLESKSDTYAVRVPAELKLRLSNLQERHGGRGSEFLETLARIYEENAGGPGEGLGARETLFYVQVRSQMASLLTLVREGLFDLGAQGNAHERLVEELEQELSDVSLKLQNKANRLTELEARLETVQAEKKSQFEEGEKQLQELREELKESRESFRALRQSLSEAQVRETFLVGAKEKLESMTKSLQETERERDRLAFANENLEMKHSRLEEDLTRARKTCEDLDKIRMREVQAFEAEHEAFVLRSQMQKEAYQAEFDRLRSELKEHHNRTADTKANET